MEIKTILVATDFSPAAERAAGYACDLAKLLDARVVVLHAWHMDIPAAYALDGSFAYPPKVVEEVEAAAKDAVEVLANELSAQRGLRIDGIAVSAPAEAAILDQAERVGADLIVLGTHGRTGLSRVLLGSVAERVVRLSEVPVLTVGPSETAG